MNSPVSVVSSTFVQAGEKVLRAHASGVAGLQFGLLATPDGFKVASVRERSDLHPRRLSAMASSLMAMARAVGREIQSPDCQRLTFEAQGNTVIIQSVSASQPCILCLVIGPEAVWGRALWAASGIAQDMARA